MAFYFGVSHCQKIGCVFFRYLTFRDIQIRDRGKMKSQNLYLAQMISEYTKKDLPQIFNVTNDAALKYKGPFQTAVGKNLTCRNKS